MNTIGVNISANKSFKHSAEELLTRNSPDIHSLLTELCASGDYHIAKAKQDQARQTIISDLTILQSAIFSGWRAAVRSEECPKAWRGDEPAKSQVRHLAQPYCAKGYSIAMTQIEHLIRRGEHSSCKRHRVPDGTQLEPPPDRS